MMFLTKQQNIKENGRTEVEKSIDLFEARSVLWDHHTVDYLKREKGEKAFAELRDELSFPVSEIRNKLNSLRTIGKRAE